MIFGVWDMERATSLATAWYVKGTPQGPGPGQTTRPTLVASAPPNSSFRLGGACNPPIVAFSGSGRKREDQATGSRPWPGLPAASQLPGPVYRYDAPPLVS
ncbi:hypothetical protein GCM10007898_30870 [Dyella flagellata]|uniref:Uncharacterized protein n=1 Tax=Dyella flagellata TaxID=1867833 RepID=A0ABQ5XEJ2_9GAMM|nr:hypothetical protein GCM10007898_30870 [Dyella flagellata]